MQVTDVLQVVFIAGVGLVSASIGYDAATRKYEEKIAKLHTEYAERAMEQAAANKKEAEENAKKLAEAISERDEALANVTALSADASRVREQAAGFGLKMPTGGTDSCKPYREKLAQSVRLLSEGADLLAEGADLLVRVSADKDAIARIAGKK